VTENLVLSPPTLQSPVSGASLTSSNVNLSWNGPSDAVGYHLQISESADFGSLVFQNQSVFGSTFNLNSLPMGKAYFWRVRGFNNGVFSAWSSIGSFSVGAPNLVLNSGLVGYWPMEDGIGNRISDVSGNNLHATIQNTSNVSWPEGRLGKSIRLDGGTGRYGEIPHQAVLNICLGKTKFNTPWPCFLQECWEWLRVVVRQRWNN
jgi:hypothetical protein